jgi:hypothetical protein
MHERNYELAKSILTNEQVDTGTLWILTVKAFKLLYVVIVKEK